MSDLFSLLEQAQVLFKLHRYNDAEMKLQEVLAIDPMNIDALMLLCNCKLNLQKTKEAKQLAENILGMAPDNNTAMALMAEACARSGDPENARLHIRGALIDGDNPDYMASLSRYLLMLREEPAAVQTAVNALKIDPNHVPALSALGLAKFQLDDYEEALEAFHRALALEPNNALLLHQIGIVLRETGQTGGAKAMFLDALRNDPNLDVSALGVAAVSYRENTIYKFHYYLLDIFKQSHVTRISFLAGSFIFLLVLAETAWKDFPVVAKLLMAACWILLLVSLSIFIVPATGNLPVIFSQQYQHLFNWKAKSRTICIALLYAVSIGFLAGIFKEPSGARWLLNSSLIVLMAPLMIQVLLGTQAFKASIIILIVGAVLGTAMYLVATKKVNFENFWTIYIAFFFANIAGALLSVFRKFQEQ